MKAVCSIDGCTKPPANGRGWCSKHYTRWVRTGDPLQVQRVRADKGAGIAEVRAALADATPDQCWPWSQPFSGRYPTLWINGKGVSAHRYVCSHREPPPSKAHHAAHSCGNSRCINPHHIRWATARENNADKVLHGTAQRGERQGQARLTAKAVAQIRESYAAGGITMDALASQYGVSRPTISAAIRGQNWSWLQSEKQQ